MKQIINGKKYDTTTATQIAIYEPDLNSSDFGHFVERLYRKKTGEFFLHGEGGPMTKYAVYHGNSTSGSERIIPLSLDEAKEWCEEHVNADMYEFLFGEVSE